MVACAALHLECWISGTTDLVNIEGITQIAGYELWSTIARPLALIHMHVPALFLVLRRYLLNVNPAVSKAGCTFPRSHGYRADTMIEG